MNDRELLELAAKAIGIVLIDRIGIQYDYTEDDRTGREWDPLRNDGDALRLAVELGLTISMRQEGYTRALLNTRQMEINISEKHADDKAASTRRAIVRAAAEIGKQKETE